MKFRKNLITIVEDLIEDRKSKWQTWDSAQLYFKKWYFWATHSKLPALIKTTKTLNKHWDGILNYFKDRYSNGMLEGLNSMIQSLKANARGYRSDENFYDHDLLETWSSEI